MDQKLRELYPRVSDSILVVSCLSVFIVLFGKRELERARRVGPGANGMMGREGKNNRSLQPVQGVVITVHWSF